MHQGSILEHAHSSLEAISLSNIEFDGFPDTDEDVSTIRINHCNLARIPTEIHRFLSLKYLDLSNNKITEIPDLTGLPNLQYLDLSINRLSNLKNVFPPEIIRLDLSFNPFLSINTVWKLQLGQLEVLKLASCKIKEIPTKKPPWAESINSLDLGGNYLTSFPLQIMEFPALDDLSLFGNELSTIQVPPSKIPFKSLNLGMNRLTDITIDPGFIIFSLTLAHNLAQFDLTSLFIRSLKTLVITDSSLIKLDFQVPPTLAILELSNDNIQEITEPFIKSLGKLSALSLSNNLIKVIPDCFPENCSISQLNLSDNQIADVPPSMINSRAMQKLNLSHNHISSLPAFRLPQLREFDISFNQITEFPDCFTCLYLNYLNVAFNKLHDLPLSLAKSHRLNELNLAFNQFLVLPSCFPSFKSLKVLDASGNKLTSLPNCLSSFPHLTVLALSNNNFASLPSVLEETSVTLLRMSHNRVSEPKTRIKEADFTANLDLEHFDNVIPPPLGSIGVSSVIGCRETMEDSYLIRGDLGLFGVFDGHAGPTSAKLSASSFAELYEGDLKGLFSKVQEFLRKEKVIDGCTAAVLALHGSTIQYGSIGDSRIIRVRNGKAERLTHDNKPLDPTEFRRLKDRDIGVTPDGRIEGKLAMSRTLGDFWCSHQLFVDPVIEEIEVLDGDEFVLACDGVWDVIDEEWAAMLVCGSTTAQDAAVTLRNAALSAGSGDNITIVVLRPTESQFVGFDQRNTVEELPVAEMEIVDLKQKLGPRQTSRHI